MHALIIEDEALIAIELQDILMQCGFTSFDFAVSSADAADCALMRCPDFITADVNLRPGNGIDAVNVICAGYRVPVLFITGNGSEVLAAMPGHAMLHKPFSSQAFTAAVNSLMSGNWRSSMS